MPVHNPYNMGKQGHPHPIPKYFDKSSNTHTNRVKLGRVPIAKWVWPSLPTISEF